MTNFESAENVRSSNVVEFECKLHHIPRKKVLVERVNGAVMVMCSGHLQASRLSIGSASSRQHVFFKMDVPKAQNVAVVVGSEWTQLEQKEPGTWHGEVVYHHSTPVDCFSAVFEPCYLL